MIENIFGFSGMQTLDLQQCPGYTAITYYGNKYTIPNGNLDLSEIIPEYREWHELAEEENRFSKPHLHSKLTLNPKQHLNLSTQALI